MPPSPDGFQRSARALALRGDDAQLNGSSRHPPSVKICINISTDICRNVGANITEAASVVQKPTKLYSGLSVNEVLEAHTSRVGEGFSDVTPQSLCGGRVFLLGMGA